MHEYIKFMLLVFVKLKGYANKVQFGDSMSSNSAKYSTKCEFDNQGPVVQTNDVVS